VWRPRIGALSFLAVRHSLLIKIADSQNWNKKTYNDAISASRRAFAFGFLDYPGQHNPAADLHGARMGKKDRPRVDPFGIPDAEVFIDALRRDWGAPQANYDEFRFFTGLRPSEEIALMVSDYDRTHGVISVTKARVDGSIRIARRPATIDAFNSVLAPWRSWSGICSCAPASRTRDSFNTTICSSPTRAHRFQMCVIRMGGGSGRCGGWAFGIADRTPRVTRPSVGN